MFANKASSIWWKSASRISDGGFTLPSVVMLYLSYDGNWSSGRAMSQLKTGARVVSYTFDMAEWQPKVAENYRDGAGASHMIYLWEIGGSLAFSDGRQ